jgi:hypothetical protein
MKRIIAFASALVISISVSSHAAAQADVMRWQPQTSAGGKRVPQSIFEDRALLMELGPERYHMGWEPKQSKYVDNAPGIVFEDGSQPAFDGSNLGETVQDGSDRSTFESGSHNTDVQFKGLVKGENGKLDVRTNTAN